MLAAEQIAIQRVGVRHDWPRQADDALIERMARSLSLAGQLQPIGVRRAGQGWILIFGYVRLLAARRLGWKTIWAVVHPEVKKQEQVDLVLWAMDNLHHAAPQLDELAVTIGRLLDAGMSHSAIALALGKSVDWVTGMQSITKDSLARDMIEEGRLAEAEAWSVFIRLAPNIQKIVMESTEPITLKFCERAQTMAVRGWQKKRKPILQGSSQAQLQSDSTLDLFSSAVMDDGNTSTFNHTHPTFNCFDESTTDEAPI